MHKINRRTFLKAASSQAACLMLSNCLHKKAIPKPNVLFIAVDDLNDWVGCYGGHPQVKTSNIDGLAQRGVMFENAHCQAPICTPSRSSLLSGKLPSTTGLYFLEPFYHQAETLRETVSLPQYFRSHGYYSIGVGKIFHQGDSPGAFDEYGGTFGSYGPNPKQKISYPIGHPNWDWGIYPEADSLMPDYKIANWAVQQLGRKYDKPFFLAVGFYRPHVPLYAPKKWFDLYPLESLKLPQVRQDDLDDISKYALDLTYSALAPRHTWMLEHDQWKHAVQSYLACVSFVDHYIGTVLDALYASDAAENTIIVLWSDHGWHLGEKLRIDQITIDFRWTRDSA